MNAPPPPPYNPYSPPQHPPEPPAAPTGPNGKLPGPALRWIFVSGVLLSALEGAGSILATGAPPGSVIAVDGILRPLIGGFLSIIALIWIYHAWRGLPVARRDGVTPMVAVGRLFIPLYNLVWMFQLNRRLCAALDSMLVARGKGAHAPRGLALFAPFLHLVGTVVELAGYAFLPAEVIVLFGIAVYATWTVYMFRVDRARTLLAS